MDRQNYARWIPVYLADMKELPSKHPEVHKEFTKGNYNITKAKRALRLVNSASTICPWVYAADVLNN